MRCVAPVSYSVVMNEEVVDGVKALKENLEIYVQSSGQEINFDKSEVFFSSNVNPNKREENPNRWNRDLIYSTFTVEEANQIWPNSIANSNFIEWLNWLLENLASNRKDDIAITIWALWFLETDISMRKRYKVQKKLLPSLGVLQGWVKINVDVGFSIANKQVVSGFIIRNDECLIMGSGFKGHNLVRSVVIAEVTTVLHGLQFALDLGFTNVILESDSKLVIQNIQQTSEDYSKSRPFTWDAKNLVRNFLFCRFQFIA
ncbi:hypothetical protein PVK06_028033 [Gossypium arboreum]|uniref:RNase H type-1 domain-containing protein n=1 Tax=Gossypium arboreum TaxID=29729 RepID=A0ABR0P1Y5_GOSAR|nr:hypothetical protein PVK06_028033 [Gossypium arboreum]